MQRVVIMTDNWDEITDLLKKDTPPQADKSAKNAAISKAVAEFEKKHAKYYQGNAFLHRLMDTVQAITETIRTIIGEFSMKKAYIIAGGVCVSIFAVTLMNTTYLSKEQLLQTGVVRYDLQDVAVAEKKSEIFTASKQGEAESLSEEAVGRQDARVKGKEVVSGDFVMSPKVSSINENAYMRKMPSSIAPEPSAPVYSYQDEGRDKFNDIKENPIKLVKEEAVSTFSIDVDTSSYSFVRASLNNNVLPQKDAVRIEEMVNYFPYNYKAPEDKSEPFKANVAVYPTPWNADTKLLHIGIKGYEIEQKEKPRSNLVFLIDTSGSMNAANKLPLLKNSMKLLLDSLQGDDTVAIVTYAGTSGVALEPTKVSDKAKIINILDSLNSSGSTAGAQGIKTAYELAESHFDKEGVNRVILATDGDFNVGVTNQEELKGFIERKRDSGIFLSVLGFGMGNYNDALMQTLAQNGNGNAAYIDNLNEARKVLVEEAGSTLFTIAKDVKIQVEFNPAKVAEYRLIGYETRLLNREDFNNDKVDAGDIGSGHSVTAIYEITPIGSKAQLIDESRYGKTEDSKSNVSEKADEYAFVKIRYKLPDGDTSKLITTPVDGKVEYKEITQAPADTRFATSVAAFAQVLRGDSYIKSYNYDDVINLAKNAKGDDEFGYRSEFINLVRLAKNAPALSR